MYFLFVFFIFIFTIIIMTIIQGFLRTFICDWEKYVVLVYRIFVDIF